MHIHTLMFGWEYPPRSEGGLGVACQGLVRGLLGNNVRVTLVLPSEGAENEPGLDVRAPTEEHVKNIRVAAMLQPYDGWADYAARIRAKGDVPAGDLYGWDLAEAVERYTALSVELTKDVAPDVVHCHDWMTYDAGVRAARHHGKPLVAHVHATELDRTDFHPNRWIADRERAGLLAADRVVAVSGYTRDILTRHYGIPGDKICVVHNAHDRQPLIESRERISSQFGLSKEPLVLFLGRLTVQKNPWQFLEVACRVRGIDPRVRFVVAGDGPLLPTLVERACELGMGDDVIFTGRLKDSEVRLLFARADCFVMPSLSEPFGLVALEAIAHGTPVIMSRQSGVAEVVDHAFKVDFWDADKMADCILTILREQPLAEQLISEAPRVLQKLTWRNQAGHIVSMYRDLLRDSS